MAVQHFFLYVSIDSHSQEKLLLALLGLDPMGGGEPLAWDIDHRDLSLGRGVLGIGIIMIITMS